MPISTRRRSTTRSFLPQEMVRYPRLAQWQTSILNWIGPPANRNGMSHGSAASGGSIREDTRTRALRRDENQ